MACKKSELVSAINSYAAARSSGDANLLAYGSRLVQQYVDTLEFAPEEDGDEAPAEAAETEVVD